MRKIYRDEQICSCLELKERDGEMKRFFSEHGKVLKLNFGAGCITKQFAKHHWIVHLQSVPTHICGNLKKLSINSCLSLF